MATSPSLLNPQRCIYIEVERRQTELERSSVATSPSLPNFHKSVYTYGEMGKTHIELERSMVASFPSLLDCLKERQTDRQT